MKYRKKILLLIMIIFLLLPLYNFSYAIINIDNKIDSKCIELRLGIHFGAHYTKAKLVEFNICNNNIMNILHEDTKEISFLDDQEKTADGVYLSQESIYNAFHAVSNIQSKFAISCSNIQCSAIAGDGIREAKNYKSFSKFIMSNHRIKMNILSEDEEGKIGFKSIIANKRYSKISKDQLITIDMKEENSFVTHYNNGDLKVYILGFGPDQLNKIIISKIKKSKDLDNIDSVNPISNFEKDVIQDICNKSLASFESKNNIIATIQNKEDSKLFAIGDIVNGRIVPALGQYNGYSDKVQVINGITRLIGKTDQYIASRNPNIAKFTKTIISDLILFYSIISSLGLNDINIAQIDHIDGLFITTEYWN